jgi:SAM-dependent methyltransferase
MKRILGKPNETNNKLISLIQRVKINNFYLRNRKDFRDQILSSINIQDNVLDIGKAMRDRHQKIISKSLETLDVNDFGTYPDIVGDICSDLASLENKYDKIICIAILEHVYDPFRAVSNLKMMLKNGGKVFGYVPYLYHYHAPDDLKFQDYFRFSKDALAYLFKDFSEVELYPIRGRISSSFHMMFAGRWKKYIEKTNINIFLDKLSSNEKNHKQCSGFNFILKK